MQLAIPWSKTKVIPWDKFFNIEYDEYIILQVVPDKSVNNPIRGLEFLARQFHSLLKERDREFFELNKLPLIYKPQQACTFEINFVGGEQSQIIFTFGVPSLFEKTIRSAIEVAWSKATIRKSPIDYTYYLRQDQTLVGKFELKDHFFKSIRVEPDDTGTLENLMSAIKTIHNNDLAIVQLMFEPLDNNWQKQAKRAEKAYLKGENHFTRLRLDRKSLFHHGAEYGFRVVEDVFNMVDWVLGVKPKETTKKQDLPKNIFSSATNMKSTHDGFNLVGHIAVTSSNQHRSKRILETIASAYKDFKKDNEFIVKPVSAKNALPLIKQRRLPTSRLLPSFLSLPCYDIITIPEVTMLLRLPNSKIQDEYPEIEQQAFREMKLPQGMIYPEGNAIPIGRTTTISPEIIHLPHKNIDERCVHSLVFGKSGSGKTTFASSQASYTFGNHLDYDTWLKEGRSVFFFDVADGVGLEQFLACVPPDRRDRVIILDYGNFDYPVYTGFADLIDTVKDDDYAYEIAHITAEIIDIATKGSLSGREQTKRWLITGLMAAYNASIDNTILEGIRILTDSEFRNNIIMPQLTNRRIKRSLEIFNQFSEDIRRNIVTPIQNRLYKIQDHSKLWNCIAQRPPRDIQGNLKHDFYKWANGDENGAYAVLIHVPSSLNTEGQNIIMAMNIAKLWYSILNNRSQVPIEQRTKETLVIFDEPHQFMTGSTYWKRMFLEARKYRLKIMMLAHGWSKIRSTDKELSETILEAGVNIHLLSGSPENAHSLRDLIQPYTIEEYVNLPDHYAINRIRAEGDNHVFISKMMDVPSKTFTQYKNSTRNDSFWISRSKEYGQSKSNVLNDIFDRENDLVIQSAILAATENESFQMPTLRNRPTRRRDIEWLRDAEDD